MSILATQHFKQIWIKLINLLFFDVSFKDNSLFRRHQLKRFFIELLCDFKIFENVCCCFINIKIIGLNFFPNIL